MQPCLFLLSCSHYRTLPFNDCHSYRIDGYQYLVWRCGKRVTPKSFPSVRFFDIILSQLLKAM